MKSNISLPINSHPGWLSGDSIFYSLCKIFSLCLWFVFIGIMVALFLGALNSILHSGVGFITSTSWNPAAGQFGAIAAISGTLLTSLIALLISVPISFGIAVFTLEVAPKRLRKILISMVQLMSGIPSIIYGMWGLFVLAPFLSKYIEPPLISIFGKLPFIGSFFSGYPLGIGIFAAGIILALMITPIISAVMYDILKTMPKTLKESAIALGATHWEFIWNIFIPYARHSLLGAITLGFGRALGETMAVTFVIGNSHQVLSIFSPSVTIASSIATEFAEANSELYRSALMELGLILFVITFIVLVIAKYLIHRKVV